FENVCALAGFSISKRTLCPARSFELRRRVFSFRPNRPYRSLCHVLTRSRDESPCSRHELEPVGLESRKQKPISREAGRRSAHLKKLPWLPRGRLRRLC